MLLFWKLKFVAVAQQSLATLRHQVLSDLAFFPPIFQLAELSHSKVSALLRVRLWVPGSAAVKIQHLFLASRSFAVTSRNTVLYALAEQTGWKISLSFLKVKYKYKLWMML